MKEDSFIKDYGPFPFLAFVLLPILAFLLGWNMADSNYKEIPEESKTIWNEKDIISNKEEIDNSIHKIVSEIDMSPLQEAYEIVNEKFVDTDKIKKDEIKYGLVRGLIASLDDPYSGFMNPSESTEFEKDMNGDLEGIGAELSVKQGMIVVVSPLRDSPAEKAGLMPEDIIIKVDGQEAPAEDFFDVVARIRGEKGSQVILTIFRPEIAEEMDIEITRDKIRVETVRIIWHDNIPVLEVSQFGTNTTNEFNKALDEVLSKNPRAIILDLRFNSGGLLDTAVDMVSSFIEGKEKVVTQKGRDESKDLNTSGKVKTSLPLVILQNNGSASASEIVAGALKELGRATVIGEQSYGKGTVQELVPMNDGSSMRITIAKWLTPNGNNINEIGIEPNIIIKRSVADYQNEVDNQLNAAIDFIKGMGIEEIIEKYNPKENQEENKKEEVLEEEK